MRAFRRLSLRAWAVLGALAALAGALWIIPIVLVDAPWTHVAFDQSPATFASVAQLAAIGLICAEIYRRRDRAQRAAGTSLAFWRRPSLIWLLIALGFLFMAVDEQLRLHERMDERILSWLDLEQDAVTDRLDDAIVALYGVVGLTLMWLYRPELGPYRRELSLLAPGLVLYILMVFIDVLTNRVDILFHLIEEPLDAYVVHDFLGGLEEALKLLSEWLLLAAFLVVRTAIVEDPARGLVAVRSAA